MLNINRTNEHGQAMILLVFAVVGLLAFTALAIDGGMIYSDRRIAQNAGDSAAVAGARKAGETLNMNQVVSENWTCTDPSVSSYSHILAAQANAIAEAVSWATNNDFTDGVAGNEVTVTTYCSDGIDYQSRYIDVKAVITTTTQSSFAHFVFSGPLMNTIEAVGRVHPSFAVGEGNSIVSLTTECQGNQKGITFGGNGDTTIDGGGMFSHSCLNLNGASGTITVTVPDSVYYSDQYNYHNMAINTTPLTTTKTLQFPIPEPDCTQVGAGTNPVSGTIYPGNYTNIRVNNNEIIYLKPGLYCLTGEFVVNGGGFVAVDGTTYADGTKDGVTIFLKNGKFSTAGTSEVHLNAYPAKCEDSGSYPGCPPALGGLLIRLADGNNSTVSLAGTASSNFDGTIFAPDGDIDVGGTNSLISEIGAQLLANNIKVHGDTDITIKYDDSLIYHVGNMLEVAK